MRTGDTATRTTAPVKRTGERLCMTAFPGDRHGTRECGKCPAKISKETCAGIKARALLQRPAALALAQRRARLEDAAVHHCEDPGLNRALGGGLVDDALLQPQRRELETYAVGDDPRHVLGTAEDIDDVHALGAAQYFGQLIERGHRGLAQDALRGRRHRDDPVAEALHGPRHTVARAGAIDRKSTRLNSSHRCISY